MPFHCRCSTVPWSAGVVRRIEPNRPSFARMSICRLFNSTDGGCCASWRRNEEAAVNLEPWYRVLYLKLACWQMNRDTRWPMTGPGQTGRANQTVKENEGLIIRTMRCGGGPGRRCALDHSGIQMTAGMSYSYQWMLAPLHHHLVLPSTTSHSSASVTFPSISPAPFILLVPSNQNSLVKATHPSCTRLVCVWACERVARGAQRDFISALKHVVCATALLQRATFGDGVG